MGRPSTCKRTQYVQGNRKNCSSGEMHVAACRSRRGGVQMGRKSVSMSCRKSAEQSSTSRDVRAAFLSCFQFRIGPGQGGPEEEELDAEETRGSIGEECRHEKTRPVSSRGRPSSATKQGTRASLFFSLLMHLLKLKTFENLAPIPKMPSFPV